MKYDIICPGCNQAYHETTDSYDPNRPPNPTMCRLKEPYLSWGWEDLPRDDGAGAGSLECPGCGCLYAEPGEKMTVRAQKEAFVDKLLKQDPVDMADSYTGVEPLKPEQVQVNGEYVCPKCGKPESAFKSRSGFVNHKRLCKG